jgi:hypothetical protein
VEQRSQGCATRDRLISDDRRHDSARSAKLTLSTRARGSGPNGNCNGSGKRSEVTEIGVYLGQKLHNSSTESGDRFVRSSANAIKGRGIALVRLWTNPA